jgi:surface antigen
VQNIDMRTYQRIWQYFQQHRMASIVVGHISVLAILGLFLLGNTMGMRIFGAFAQSPCSSGDRTYSVVNGDTLGGIAARYRTTWQRLASYNHIANPNVIYVGERVCIPGQGQGGGSGSSGGPSPVRGTGNYFPYGQCTWWANERYHQLRGVYVPWTANSDAWAWTARARQFNWRVSTTPAPGDIVDLQPGVQGAYSLGHVAVVERVLGDGHVIASTMNWGVYYWKVVNVEFSPGPGVSFIRFQ